ncbi:hypothetical protein DYGSA30_24720 [Dyella sp. GSA-30]|nr:hypothetical protein DYGSA30_24720 [Dyella sp. GSA-30]
MLASIVHPIQTSTPRGTAIPQPARSQKEVRTGRSAPRPGGKALGKASSLGRVCDKQITVLRDIDAPSSHNEGLEATASLPHP